MIRERSIFCFVSKLQFLCAVTPSSEISSGSILHLQTLCFQLLRKWLLVVPSTGRFVKGVGDGCEKSDFC